MSHDELIHPSRDAAAEIERLLEKVAELEREKEKVAIRATGGILELKQQVRTLREALEAIVSRVALISPYYEQARTALDASEPRPSRVADKENKALAAVLRQIVSSLPQKRDWLD